MTVKKLQGQTIRNVGVYFPTWPILYSAINKSQSNMLAIEKEIKNLAKSIFAKSFIKEILTP